MFNSSYYRLKPCSCQNYTILSSLYTQNSRDTKDDITWYRFSSAGGRDQKRQNWPKGMSASSEQFYVWSHWEKPENIASVWKVCCFQFSGLFPGSLSQILLAFQLWIACLIYHHLIISICLPLGKVDKALLWFSYTLHLLLGCFAQLACRVARGCAPVMVPQVFHATGSPFPVWFCGHPSCSSGSAGRALSVLSIQHRARQGCSPGLSSAISSHDDDDVHLNPVKHSRCVTARLLHRSKSCLWRSFCTASICTAAPYQDQAPNGW